MLLIEEVTSVFILGTFILGIRTEDGDKEAAK